jgi:prepilin-type N-terminal cleavage/methylation domain-containing protein/prepilin-type processing-associated H-X9-DG protein
LESTQIQRRQRSPAFTLIELLVVIAIIAIIAAILFPTFAQAREKARQTACASNLRQLGMAFLQYVQDYDETFPGAYNGGNGVDTAGANVGGWIYYKELLDQMTPPGPDFDPTRGSIYPYVKNSRIYVCPDDTLGQTTGDSYAVNSCIDNPLDITTFFSTGRPLAAFSNPTQIMLLSEEDELGNGGSTNDGFLNLNFSTYFPDGHDDFASRHSGGVEVSFMDGHVKWYQTTAVHVVGVQTGVPNEVPGVSTCP